MQSNELHLQHDITLISGTEPRKCMGCGKCSATCPASFEMDILPHRFVKCVNDGNVSLLFESETILKCLSCFACAERCPRGVEPAALVEAVRAFTFRKKGGNRLSPDDIPDFIENDEEIPQQLIVSAFRKFSR